MTDESVPRTDFVEKGRQFSREQTEGYDVDGAVHWLKVTAKALAKAEREHPDTIDFMRGHVLGAIDVLEAAQAREMAKAALR